MMLTFVYYVVPTLLIFIGIRKCRERKWGRCTNDVKLQRKVVIITGANSGIGYEIAKELAIREAQVIMACRNLDEAAKATCRLKRELKCSSIIVPMKLNLASVKSITGFVKEIKSTYSAIHLLINNAGVSYPDKDVKTEDGFEIHIGTNHLGHFLLTNMLMDTLKRAGKSRVVIISSLLHEKGKIYLNNLNLDNMQDTDPYANSKLANIYFAKQLANVVKNTGVTVYTVFPGWTFTNLFRHYKRKWYQNLFVFPVALLFMRSAKQGAQTAIYCATEPSLDQESGLIYRDCKRYTSKVTFENSKASKLWEVSETMISEVEQNGLDN